MVFTGASRASAAIKIAIDRPAPAQPAGVGD
jgi:hypothetical protein